MLLLWGCGAEHMTLPEVHGHRGCRGLMPENTVPAFLKAVELGCTWLEMDVVMTGDGEVLVSHEPWMDHGICRTPQGDSILPVQERTFNIFRMTTAEAQAFDCGTTPQPDFPEQENLPAHKPTLREVVEAVDDLAAEGSVGSISYNIEIKSEPALYGTFQPEPVTFAKAVLAVIEEMNIGDRCILQSFDPAILEAVRELDPSIRLALLVENTDGVEANLKRLSFIPEVYAPALELIDRKAVESVHAADMELVVWTVNGEDAIRNALKLGVDGIISDHPDRVLRILDEP